MTPPSSTDRVALVTGGSRGLGRALTQSLATDGWHVVVDARDATALAASVAGLRRPDLVTTIPGDVADPAHRDALATGVRRHGRLDLLVCNASELGPTPLPRLADLQDGALERVLAVNTVAPLALIRLLLPLLRASGGRVLTVSSDAAVEAYPGWGAYGSTKAALDHLTAVLAVEEPDVRWYAVDPGDMATGMHAAAVPDADPADLSDPADVAGVLLRLTAGELPSGRYRASDLVTVGGQS